MSVEQIWVMFGLFGLIIMTLFTDYSAQTIIFVGFIGGTVAGSIITTIMKLVGSKFRESSGSYSNSNRRDDTCYNDWDN